MDKLEALKEQLKALSQEEVAELKEFLSQAPAEETIEAVPENTEEVKDAEVDTAETAIPVEEPAPAETTDPETTPEETPSAEPEAVPEVNTEEEQAEQVETIPTGEQEEQAPAQQPTFDDIPKMEKGIGAADDTTSNQVMAETGETLPVDFEQIIEAQNAKIAALQAENATLKTKVEGAFGYSAKPANQVRVNRLYDEATDLHFHK